MAFASSAVRGVVVTAGSSSWVGMAALRCGDVGEGVALCCRASYGV